ncbi:calcium-binding protein [Phenylobacterium sp.]|uniref:calcium-binding protein n=1 Tax=Phenylobacterium sp. TaxID=1871053 RepID=UPI0035B373C2
MKTISGTAGADTIVGGPEAELIFGWGGADRLLGGGGDDYLSYRDGTGIFLDGGDGNDSLEYDMEFYAIGTLVGGAGDDRIVVGPGSYTVDAGSGDDLVTVPMHAGATVTLGSGRDAIDPSLSPMGPAMVVTDFQAGPGGDRIYLEPYGYADWDGVINPMTRYYRLVQDGADAVLQRYSNDPGYPPPYSLGWFDSVRLQNVQASQLTADNLFGWPPDGSPPANLHVVGGVGGDSLTGGPGFDLLEGGGGSDIIYPDDGHDTVLGGAGDDTLQGSIGDDRLFGDDGNDVVSDAYGSNYLRGGSGDDSVSGGAQFDDLHGNAGADTINGRGGDDWVVGGQDGDRLLGAGGADIVYGNLGDDICDGEQGNDIVRGGQGNDTIAGGIGLDWLSGDRGDDTISGGVHADIFHGSQDAGLDRITDFNAAEGDRVQLDPGTTYTLRQAGADTVVDMGGGHQMVLVNVQLSSLPQGWIFGA